MLLQHFDYQCVTKAFLYSYLITGKSNNFILTSDTEHLRIDRIITIIRLERLSEQGNDSEDKKCQSCRYCREPFILFDERFMIFKILGIQTNYQTRDHRGINNAGKEVARIMHSEIRTGIADDKSEQSQRRKCLLRPQHICHEQGYSPIVCRMSGRKSTGTTAIAIHDMYQW